MFVKPSGTSKQNHFDNRQQDGFERLHPANVETLPTFEPPTIVNGSVIGSDLKILGENINIVSTDCLQIDGEVHGDVTGKQVIVGVSGLVVGTICAQNVQVDGGVRGLVRAQEVHLNAEAKVSGELVHKSLEISKGAEFEGRVRRARNDAELKPDLETTPLRPMAKPQTPELSPEFFGEPARVEPLGAPHRDSTGDEFDFSLRADKMG